MIKKLGVQPLRILEMVLLLFAVVSGDLIVKVVQLSAGGQCYR